jgi:hypothetical protein
MWCLHVRSPSLEIFTLIEENQRKKKKLNHLLIYIKVFGTV